MLEKIEKIEPLIKKTNRIIFLKLSYYLLFIVDKNEASKKNQKNLYLH